MTSTAQTDRRAYPPQRTRTRRAGSWFGVLARTGRLPAFLVACGCLVVLYGFLFSGDYAVNDVTVRGAQLGDPFEIAGATGAMDVSVFRVEAGDISAQLAQLPYVERVDVETRLPSRVVVTIVEREPVVSWNAADGPVLIDAHGKVLQTGEGDGVPTVEGDSMELSPGDAMSAERIAAVVAIQEVLGADVSVLAWNERNGLTAQLEDKRLVIFGEADRFPLKLAVYQEVQDSDLTWSVLDLREPDRPYFE